MSHCVLRFVEGIAWKSWNRYVCKHAMIELIGNSWQTSLMKSMGPRVRDMMWIFEAVMKSFGF